MVILGVWDGHDAGAALFCDGRLVAAVNEERFTRRKLEICFPAQSIACCLRLAGIGARQVDVVALSTSDIAKTLARWAPGTKERYYQLRRRKIPRGRFGGVAKAAKYWMTEWRPNGVSRALSRAALGRELRALGFGTPRLEILDHHACHAAAAAWASGFDACAVVTIDGVGDGLSSTLSRFAGGRLTRVAESPARHSLGIFFEHVTNLLNMRELEDEGKVMALSDYAAPVPDDQNALLPLFSVREGRLASPVAGHALMSRLAAIQWTWPNEQFAYMAQRTVEAVCLRLVADAVALTGLTRVALAGGVASNVKANRRIRLNDQVEALYVFPHMGDGGLALGAAVAASGQPFPAAADPLADLALGPEYSDREIAAALDRAGLRSAPAGDLAASVADLIAADRIVMWFQGRMEYGPRALGCRSVLARPDRVAIRDRLNLVLKQRVWYQPFCPSLLESDARAVLADYAGRPHPHMTMAYAVTPAMRPALAGVTSVDGTCRPQIVPDEAAGVFPDLLRAVKTKLGQGVVLNTSYNIHGEPLVCTPAEAIDVFRRTEADALAIGPYLVTREHM